MGKATRVGIEATTATLLLFAVQPQLYSDPLSALLGFIGFAVVFALAELVLVKKKG